MKNLLVVFTLVLTYLNLTAQNCQGKKYFVKGTKLSFENKKEGKTVGTDNQEVLSVVSSSQGMEATVSSDLSAKEKNGPVTYKITCNGNTISFDLKALVDQEIAKKLNNSGMEVKIISSDNLDFPVSAKAGIELKEAKIALEIGIQGNPIGTVNIVIKNRKVEGEEKITTPAGTFSCLKVTADFEMETIILGAPNKKKVKNTSWVSDSVGPVKSENVDANGKIENTRILVKVE